MNTTKQSELEGLANRIAMLVGEDGEAEAAGRAVGVLARRLGLTGGHLKAIFIAGAGNLGATGRQAAELAARAERHEAEAKGLAHSLEQVQIALQHANRECDSLRAELGALELAMDGMRSARRLQLAVFGIVLLSLVAGGGYVWYGGWLSSGPIRAVSDPAAVVRARGTTVYAEADLGSAVTARLPAGVRVVVRDLVWRNFNQWVETSVAGRTGYAPATDLDLPQDK